MSGSYPTWSFGCPVSWQEIPVPALLRSEIQDGYPKVRRQFTKDWSQHEGQWTIAKDKVNGLRTFISIDCQGGAQPFQMEDPFTGELRLFRWIEPPTIAGSVNTLPHVTLSARLETVFS